MVLWTYIVLLIAGGIAGYVKAGSKHSLTASLVSAAVLSACALGWINAPYFPEIILGVLLLFFVTRFARNGKFMPGGLMTVITAAALALRFFGRR